MSKETPTSRWTDRPGTTQEVRFRSRQVALVYLLLSLGWILVTDWLVEYAVADRVNLILAELVKGTVFVLGSAALVYWLARRAALGIQARAFSDHLEATENLLEKVMANLGEAVFLIDPPTRTIKRCNEAATVIFGYTREELVGHNTALLHLDESAYARFGQVSEAALARHGVFRCTLRMQCKDGKTLHTENTVVAVRDSFLWQAGAISIVRDITERVQAKAALEESERRYRLLAENTLDVIWTMDMDLTFTYVNPAVAQLTGHSAEEFAGSRLQDHCDDSTFAELRETIEGEIAKGPEQPWIILRTRLLRKDGSPVAVEVRGRVLFDPHGLPAGLQGTARNITQQLALEGQLRQAQKMEAIGTLAAGIAHEINNPLMAVTNYAELISARAEAGSRIAMFAGEIRQGMERIHLIVRNLLGFARTDQRPERQPVRLRNIVEDTQSLSQALLRHDQIALAVDIPENLPEVMGNRQQLQQVVMNLLTNARDALNQKFPGSDPDKRIQVTGSALTKEERTWLRLTVEDLGPGIPVEERDRLFEPFFTTKAEGEGTGLGLWIVYTIVKDHGGRIQVESEPDRFTRILVDLPVRT